MNGQEIVELPLTISNDGISWELEERQYHDENWNTLIVDNISQPRMEVFRPTSEWSNGVGILVIPGGGMYANSIASEGTQVAEWLAANGYTAFVLKYRLVPTAGNATKAFWEDGEKAIENAKSLLKLATNDALNALLHIRENSEAYYIDKKKVGIIGFSAGGAITMNSTYLASANNQPNFIVPVYAWMDIVDEAEVPVHAPPMFVICAEDDPMDLAEASRKLNTDWKKAGKITDLKMYKNGGHGFGMKEQNLPSDQWIELMGEWLKQEGFVQ